MDFSISPKTQELVARVREFVSREVQPLELRLGEPWRALEPAQRGLPLGEFAHVSEELGRSPLGHYAVNCQAPDVGNMELLELAGSAEQKEEWLEPLAAGSIRSC